MNDQLHIGIAGACARGGHFKSVFDAIPSARIHAVCDTNAGGLDEAADRLGADERYTDYSEMLERSKLDAVIIGTPMHLHARQAIAALNKDIHVFSEVTAGVTLDECRALVEACKNSNAIYMMGENYIYTRPNALVTALVRQGLLGEPYYAEGEYIHELKGMNRDTPWRRKWQTGIDGLTYGTHSLGPILQWMEGDRVESVCCAGSGHHWTDLDGRAFEAQDTSVMLCKMAKGGLVKIRVDMISDRPHAMTNYHLQGTDGCYESARAEGEPDRIWLRSRSKDINSWLDLKSLENEFLPDDWRDMPQAAEQAGHGGGDFFEILEFIETAKGNRANPIDIHAAMSMTLPGLASQQSVAEDGSWIDVPDSREW
jgi:predicted dehydrogenase